MFWLIPHCNVLHAVRNIQDRAWTQILGFEGCLFPRVIASQPLFRLDELQRVTQSLA